MSRSGNAVETSVVIFLHFSVWCNYCTWGKEVHGHQEFREEPREQKAGQETMIAYLKWTGLRGSIHAEASRTEWNLGQSHQDGLLACVGANVHNP